MLNIFILQYLTLIICTQEIDNLIKCLRMLLYAFIIYERVYELAYELKKCIEFSIL